MLRYLLIAAACLVAGCDLPAPQRTAAPRPTLGLVARGETAGHAHRVRYDDGRRAPAEAVVRGRP